MRFNYIDRMNEMRATMPANGGKRYARAHVRQSDLNALMPAGSHERFCYSFRAGWKSDKDLILEDFRRFLYPERYEEFT